MAWKRMTKVEELCRIHRRHGGPFTYEDLMKAVPGILPTDKIKVNNDPGFSSDNYSYESYSELIVTRERDYTDEEQKEFEQFMEERKAKSKFIRYEEYLTLKGEFDGQSAPDEPEWDEDEVRDRNFYARRGLKK